LLRDGSHSTEILGGTDEGGGGEAVGRRSSGGHGDRAVLRLLEGVGGLEGGLRLLVKGWGGGELRLGLRLGLVEGLLGLLLGRLRLTGGKGHEVSPRAVLRDLLLLRLLLELRLGGERSLLLLLGSEVLEGRLLLLLVAVRRELLLLAVLVLLLLLLLLLSCRRARLSVGRVVHRRAGSPSPHRFHSSRMSDRSSSRTMFESRSEDRCFPLLDCWSWERSGFCS